MVNTQSSMLHHQPQVSSAQVNKDAYIQLSNIQNRYCLGVDLSGPSCRNVLPGGALTGVASLRPCAELHRSVYLNVKKERYLLWAQGREERRGEEVEGEESYV